jgi:hypothetical protein
MRNRIAIRWLCVAVTAIFAGGCSEQAQAPSAEGTSAGPPPVYAGGSTTPPTTTASGKPIKNPKIINMHPSGKIVQ